MIPLRRANNDFAILEDHLNLPPKDWLPGVELISFIMGRATGQIVYKKDRLEITKKDFLRAGACCTFIRKEVEAVLGREKIGGSSLGDPTVSIADNDGIHGTIFQLARPVVKAPQPRIIASMRINLVTPFAEKDAVKALGARWDAAKKIWYITDVADLTPFLRWIPALEAAKGRAEGNGTGPTTSAAEVPTSKGITTKPAAEVPHCGCKVLPWEDCVHTATAGLRP